MIELEILPETETAAPIAAAGYTWWTYNRPVATTIKNATGKRAVRLKEGSEFGIRSSSNGKSVRMITRELGPTFVFTLDSQSLGKITMGAQRVGKGKTAKVTKSVMTKQSKQVKPPEPTATQKASNDPFVQSIGSTLKAFTPKMKLAQITALNAAVRDVYAMDTDKGMGDPKRRQKTDTLMRQIFRFKGADDKPAHEDRKTQGLSADIVAFLKTFANTQFKASRYQIGDAGEAFELYAMYCSLAYALHMGDPSIIARNERKITILDREMLPASTRRRLVDLAGDDDLFDKKKTMVARRARKALGSWA